jgi:4,5-DOPA dioxygenase extradiol
VDAVFAGGGKNFPRLRDKIRQRLSPQDDYSHAAVIQKDQGATKEMSKRMPAIFFGHGNPMNAIAQNAYTQGWNDLGRAIPKPKAILCVSAHWYIPAVAVTAMDRPRTIHDFGGFPRALFEVQYPAPGSPELAGRVNELLGGDLIQDESSWGLDHGTWSVLCHVFPNADIPVVQLSIDETQPAQFHYDLAKNLVPLREEGVLVIGSGNLVHNLHTYAWGKQDVEPFDWAVRFESAARELMVTGDHQPLVDHESLGRDAMLSAPTPDHYVPLLYNLGVRQSDDDVTFPVDGFDGGSISMLTVQVG